jgi:hypothetical protein
MAKKKLSVVSKETVKKVIENINIPESAKKKKELNIVFCLPGPTGGFSGRFFDSWIRLTGWCKENNINMIVSREGGSNVFTVRQKCLGAHMSNGLMKHVDKPFDGKIDYDYIMWIDSDIIFWPKAFELLLEGCESGLDVITGCYKKDDSTFCFLPMDQEGKVAADLKWADIAWTLNQKELIECYHAGMGFMLIKKGVYEKLQQPYFTHGTTEINGEISIAGEDVAHCWRIRQAGFKIYADPRIIVGHEKLIVC